MLTDYGWEYLHWRALGIGYGNMPSILFSGVLHRMNIPASCGHRNPSPAPLPPSKQRLGPRGFPGEPAQPNALRESETQIPKGIDPGHTA